MYAAYDTLSPGLKKTLDGMRAVHSNAHVFGAGSAYKRTDAKFRNENLVSDAVHPVVVTHPMSGKKALYVNPGRSEEHTSELQSLMRISYAGLCLQKTET